MGLPMQVGQRTVGALVVAHTVAHPRGFTSLCQQVGVAVSQQAALAVEHARLFEVERDNAQRLRDLDRMKADWMVGVTHDLKAPLTGLLGFAETLERMVGQVSEDQQRQFLNVMSRQADQLVDLVEDLLLSARVDADAVARRHELAPIDELVVDAVESLSPEERAKVEVRDDSVSTPCWGTAPTSSASCRTCCPMPSGTVASTSRSPSGTTTAWCWWGSRTTGPGGPLPPGP